MASASPSLLPKLASDFNTKDYWKRFNEGTGSFEWYGNFRQLESIVRRYVAVGASTLVIGCGNSTFSVDLYESGITSDIVYIDFDDERFPPCERGGGSDQGSFPKVFQGLGPKIGPQFRQKVLLYN